MPNQGLQELQTSGLRAPNVGQTGYLGKLTGSPAELTFEAPTASASRMDALRTATVSSQRVLSAGPGSASTSLTFLKGYLYVVRTRQVWASSSGVVTAFRRGVHLVRFEPGASTPAVTTNLAEATFGTTNTPTFGFPGGGVMSVAFSNFTGADAALSGEAHIVSAVALI